MSATQKAIKITADNYLGLTTQYAEEDPEFFKDAINLYLVADFGESLQYDIVKTEELSKTFVKTGKLLQNGYFEVTRRGVEN